MQDVGHNMWHLYVAQLLPSLYIHAPMSYLLPMTTNGELNRQFPFAIDLNKILPDLLKLRTKVEKADIEFSQHTWVNGPKAQPGSKLYVYALG